jgi:SNF2 family DNA or RNA helicase
MIFEPHPYQQYCIDRIVQDKQIALFLDMGLGKTVITLTALWRLKYHYFSVRKILIIAPKKVAEAIWHREAAKWEHLRDLTFSIVLGTAEQRVQALERRADIYVINRDNVVWLVEYYQNGWPFDVVVLDESSSFKNHRAKRFRALKAVRPKINRVIALTGTPTPQGLMDLWAQIYLLDFGKRLGRTITAYRDAYFVPDKRSRTVIYSYAPREGAAEQIQAAVSDICISMKAEDYLTLSDCIYEDIPVALDAVAAKAYKQLEREALLAVGEDQIITAGTAATLTGKLLQLCNGAVYDETGAVTHIHDCKVEAFAETLEQLGGNHAVVYYNFRHDRERLIRYLETTGKRFAVYEGGEQEIAWNAGELDILLAHPASCGYGLNLQDGGHHIIWFGLTWSLEQYLQANKRLHRQGQKYPVIVHHLVTVGGVDEDVIKTLNRKDETQESLLAALNARLRAERSNSDGD